MKKVLIVGLFFLAFGLIKSPPVQAGDKQLGEMCKFDAECLDPDPNSRCLDVKCDKSANPSAGICSQVTVTCADPNPNDCTKVECSPTSGTCVNALIPSCGPTSYNNCSDYITNSPSYECCKLGFNEKTDPEKFKCCVEHVNKKENPGTPTSPLPCRDRDCPECPRCPETGRCPECPKPTPLDCGMFKDAETKACCEKFKNFPPAMVIAKCVKPGECNNSINIVAEAGATVSLSNFNQCCQYITNPGSMADVTISQICNNITTTPGAPSTPATPGTPTTPSGSPATSAAQCSCTPRETIQGTAFAGTPWDCEFQAPSTEGPLSLSAAASLVVTTEAPFNVVDPAAGEMKSARLPNTNNKFEVRGPILANWHDNPDNAGKVTACTQDAAGNNLSCGDCLVATKAQIFGGAGGEGGCSLRRNP